MNEAEAQKVVDEINAHLKKQLWMDFTVSEFDGSSLLVEGGVSIHRPRPWDIEITFGSVFCISLPVDWKTDTSEPPLALLTGDEAYAINARFGVVHGNHVFRFTPEDYPPDLGCIIAAERVSYQLPDGSVLLK